MVYTVNDLPLTQAELVAALNRFYAYTPPTGATPYPGTPTWTLYKDGSDYILLDATRAISYQDTSMDDMATQISSSLPGNGKLFIRPGTYTFTSPWTLDGGASYLTFGIEGETRDSVILDFTGTTGAGLHIKRAAGSTLSTFTLAMGTNSTYGIQLDGANALKVGALTRFAITSSANTTGQIGLYFNPGVNGGQYHNLIWDFYGYNLETAIKLQDGGSDYGPNWNVFGKIFLENCGSNGVGYGVYNSRYTGGSSFYGLHMEAQHGAGGLYSDGIETIVYDYICEGSAPDPTKLFLLDTNSRGCKIEVSAQNLTTLTDVVGLDTGTYNKIVSFYDGTEFFNGHMAGAYGNKGASVGNGSEQTIAHGCSFTPSVDQVFLSERQTGGALAKQTTIPDATNIYITATNGKDYNWKVER